MKSRIMEFCNIKKRFRNGRIICYHGSMSFFRGSIVILRGDSGVGKSTLIHLLSLLDTAEIIDNQSFIRFFNSDSDSIDLLNDSKVLNTCLELIRPKIGFLPQGAHILPIFSIYENALLSILAKFPNVNNKQAEMLIKKTFLQVGLTQAHWEKRHKSPATLSGGEMQRLALARTILGEPKIIFVDEPTVYMDEKLLNNAINLFVEFSINSECTIVLVTHQYEEVLARFRSVKQSINVEEYVLHQKQSNGGSSEVNWTKKVTEIERKSYSEVT